MRREGAKIRGRYFVPLLLAAAIAVGCAAPASPAITPVDADERAESLPAATVAAVPVATVSPIATLAVTELARAVEEPTASPSTDAAELPAPTATVAMPEPAATPITLAIPEPAPLPTTTLEPSTATPAPASAVLPTPAPTAAPPRSPTPVLSVTATTVPTPTPTFPPFTRSTGFVPLTNPRFVNAADRTDLSNDAYVLGLDWNGERRAYPLSMMAYHHIVNDTVAGDPALVTF